MIAGFEANGSDGFRYGYGTEVGSDSIRMRIRRRIRTWYTAIPDPVSGAGSGLQRKDGQDGRDPGPDFDGVSRRDKKCKNKI